MNDEGELISRFNHSKAFYAIQIDLEGNFSFVNDLFSQRYGLDIANLNGKPWYSLVYEDDRGKCKEAVQRVFKEKGSPVYLRLRKPKANDGFYFTEWELTLRKDSKKELYIEGIGYNVTTQHKQLNALLSNTSDRMALLNSSGQLLETLSNDLDLSMSQGIKQIIHQNEFFIDGNCIGFGQLRSRLMSFGQLTGVEYCQIDKGLSKWFLATASYIEYDGEACILWIARDITQQKNTELKLLQQNRKLQEIAYIQSHRVRRPVANIIGLLPLLEKEVYTEEGKMLMEMLKECVDEMDGEIHKIVKKSNAAA